MRGRVREGSIEDAEWCTACRNGETIRHNVRQNEKTLFVVVGCKTKVRNDCVAKDSIVVTYYRGHYESFDAVYFEDMKQMSDRKMPNETISLDSTLFRKFKGFIKKVSRDRLSADDVRFYLKCHKDEITMGIPVHLHASQEQVDKSLRYTNLSDIVEDKIL